jgi:hypothetical protein
MHKKIRRLESKIPKRRMKGSIHYDRARGTGLRGLLFLLMGYPGNRSRAKTVHVPKWARFDDSVVDRNAVGGFWGSSISRRAGSQRWLRTRQRHQLANRTNRAEK